MRTKQLLILLMLALSMTLTLACGGGGNDDDDDDDDTWTPPDGEPGVVDEAAAGDIAKDVVNNLEFQQNTENVANVNQFVPQGIRGKVAKIGLIAQAITIPGEVPCQSIEFDGTETDFDITISYDGQCEVMDGTVYTGSIRMHMSGTETDLEMEIEFVNYSENGQPISGTMIADISQNGTRSEISIRFENFTSEGETLNGAMAVTAEEDGSYIRAEFQGFDSPEGSLDGFYEVTANGPNSLTVSMNLTGDNLNGVEFEGDYSYTLTENADGTVSFSGTVEYFNEWIDQTVDVNFNLVVDPSCQGEWPSDGTMQINGENNSWDCTFACDSYTVQ